MAKKSQANRVTIEGVMVKKPVYKNIKGYSFLYVEILNKRRGSDELEEKNFVGFKVFRRDLQKKIRETARKGDLVKITCTIGGKPSNATDRTPFMFLRMKDITVIHGAFDKTLAEKREQQTSNEANKHEDNNTQNTAPQNKKQQVTVSDEFKDSEIPF